MNQDLHQALKSEVISKKSVGGVNFILTKLQYSKDNFGYSLHAEPNTFTFSGGPQTSDFLAWLGFERSVCGFIPRGECYVCAVVQNFSLDEFCSTFEKIVSLLASTYNDLSSCGYILPTDEGSSYFLGRSSSRMSSRGYSSYYGNGHSAIQNPKKMKEAEDGSFKYVFSFQTTPEGKGWTIHIHLKNIISEELSSALSFIGIKKFSECPQFEFEPCFWSFIPFQGSDREDRNVSMAHNQFNAHEQHFAKGINALMEANSLAKNIGMNIFT